MTARGAPGLRFRLLGLLVLLPAGLVAPGCVTGRPAPSAASQPTRETARETARARFHEGWSLIMDAGRWSDAERAFRAALAADPDWVLARALVGRITTDLQEREELLAWIEAHLDGVDPDERLLLEVYVSSLRAANARDRGETPGPDSGEQRLAVAITNSRRYLERHPDDAYVAAELIEGLAARDGAQAALDAMDSEIDPAAAQVPFFLSFRAALLSDLGRHEEALALARQFEATLDDPGAPAPHALYAQLLLDSGQLDEASQEIDAAVALDAANLSAQALQGTIRARLAGH